ncbi:MAG: hypothetical protein QXK37_01330 [Candidatus Woesearchaeota archaeon]
MKNAIITCSDEKCGDFLVNHWFFSLRTNVNLKDIDVVVLDYGMSEKQRSVLKEHGAILYRCVNDGPIVINRFRDAATFLTHKKYDQIMFCDGGDIIFQKDISHLFEENKKSFRVVCENLIQSRFIKLSLLIFKTGTKHEFLNLLNYIQGKKMINTGLIIGNCRLLKTLCKETLSKIDKKMFGADQLFINFYLYEHGFVELSEKYNFIPSVAREPFFIKKGIFYLKSGEVIPVVHNAGWLKPLRVVDNFGYKTAQLNKKKVLLRKAFLFAIGLKRA